MIASFWSVRARSAAPLVAFGLFLVTLPLFMPTALQGVFTRILIFGIFVLSLDVIFGYAGLWSFGHAAFFGVGAYVVGLLVLKAGITSFWLAASGSFSLGPKSCLPGTSWP